MKKNLKHKSHLRFTNEKPSTIYQYKWKMKTPNRWKMKTIYDLQMKTWKQMKNRNENGNANENGILQMKKQMKKPTKKITQSYFFTGGIFW